MKNNLKLNFKIWLENNDGESILGDGKWKLLKAIQETESLKKGIEQCGYSYRKTWNKLQEIETKLGFQLIERQRGGIAGGKTMLTPEGEKIMKLFEDFHLKFDAEIKLYLENQMNHFFPKK